MKLPSATTMTSNKRKASSMAIWLFAFASAAGLAEATPAVCHLNIGPSDSANERANEVLPVDLTGLPLPCDDAPNPILVTMPNGSTKRFRKTRAAAGSFHGEASEDGSSLQYIRDRRGALFGSLVDLKQNTVLQFHLDGAGQTVVTVVPTEDFPDESDPVSHRRLQDDADASSVTTTSSHLLRGTSTTNQGRTLQALSTIDVLVVWTAAAECRNSGLSVGCARTATTLSNMQGRIDLAVAETNTAYELSGINAELRVVHSYLDASYAEASSNAFNTALNEITSTTDGVMDDVHDLRTTYGADVVAMIIDDPQYCGIAWLGPTPAYMFSVTAWNCATGYYSFGHEIGHNLGALHDRGTSNACTSSDSNYGWRDPEGRFRSILAYNCVSGQCDQNVGGGCPRVQRFSNPTLGYNGFPIGDFLSDNANQINSVAPEVAGYYATSTPGCSSDAECQPSDLCLGPGTCNLSSGECSYNSPVVCTTTSTCGALQACNSLTGTCEDVGTGEDGTCRPDLGETCSACPGDCEASYMSAICGNGVCEDGEDTTLCGEDCNGITSGKPANRFECIGGPGGCLDSRCNSSGFTCTTAPASGISCCGDNVCEGDETFESCPYDCPAPVPTSSPSSIPTSACPICSHTGQPCCGTCISGGKPANRGCFP